MNLQLLLYFLGAIISINAYKILVVYPFPVKSLSILGDGFVRHLSKAGHEVTYVTAFPTKQEAKGYRQIDISSIASALTGEVGFSISTVMNNEMPMNDVQMLQEYAVSMAEASLNHNAFKKLLEDKNEQFDAVIVDLYETEIYGGLAQLYNCPMIWSYSMGAHWLVLRLIDEPTNPAYTSDYLSSNVLPFTFKQRLEELWAQINWSWIKWSKTMPKEKETYRKVFKPLLEQRGRVVADYEEVLYNTSLIFGNEHHAFGNLPKIPQNFKFIGGFHIQTPPKPLPQDLQALMDNSKGGVIYFSMGSAWSSKDFPKPVLDDLLKVFGELKQTVIWKFEADLPNAPKNLKIMKWAPQPSILAHPNCQFFITHGGLLSSTEAIHFGVPIIGIPIFFDQFVNINKAAAKGYAIRVPLNYDLANSLRVAIKTMLTDSKYKDMAKKLSSIYHDRPMTAGQELVHWVEHVVRTDGAPHLRSPALHVPVYQKLYLDLAAILFLAVLLLYVAVKKLVRRKTNLKKKDKEN